MCLENCFDVLQATVGNHQRFYIAAQGPLPGTVGSFWQMIWEADVYLVVMLTGAQEEGSTIYCPGMGERCVDVGEVSCICFHYCI
jgi:tyrosine-protein phosphatase non-receptor type 14/21